MITFAQETYIVLIYYEEISDSINHALSGVWNAG
jgi:hypothetical protein